MTKHLGVEPALYSLDQIRNMHDSLTKVPRPVVTDANILLDAAFVPNGDARRSMFLLRQLGITPIIDTEIEFETRA